MPERLLATRVFLVLTVHGMAVVALFEPTISGFIALVAMHVITGGFGISLGYHRLLTHKAFVTSRWMNRLLAFCGVMALQGGPITWVALHKEHHRNTDRTGDPHSSTRGFFWAHIGWSLYTSPNGFALIKATRLVQNLMTDKFIMFLERYHLVLNALGFIVTWTFLGRDIALWAWPVRIIVVWHSTWLINSLAHGASMKSPNITDPRTTGPGPRDIVWLACLTYGEGYHLQHHSHPTAQRFGFWDPGYWILSGLRIFGLIRDY